MRKYDFRLTGVDTEGGVQTINLEVEDLGLFLEIQHYESYEEKNPAAPDDLNSSTLWNLKTEDGEEYSVAEYVKIGNFSNTSGEFPMEYRDVLNACQKWLGNQWIDIPKIPWKCFKN